MITIKLLDARRGLNRKCRELFRNERIAEEIYRYLCEGIEECENAEPERKTGRWEITHAYPHNVHCSECHKKFAQTHWAVWKDGSLPRNYCPNCGAKMEEEK